MTKGIGLEGTAILPQDFADVARRAGLTKQNLAEGRTLVGQVSLVPEALAVAAHGVTAMHDVTQGGLLQTFWKSPFSPGSALRWTSQAPRCHASSLASLEPSTLTHCA